MNLKNAHSDIFKEVYPLAFDFLFKLRVKIKRE